MKPYRITTGAVFGLVTLAHLWRMIDEWPNLTTDPWYVSLTLAAAALCLSALRLLRRSVRDA